MDVYRVKTSWHVLCRTELMDYVWHTLSGLHSRKHDTVNNNNDKRQEANVETVHSVLLLHFKPVLSHVLSCAFSLTPLHLPCSFTSICLSNRAFYAACFLFYSTQQLPYIFTVIITHGGDGNKAQIQYSYSCCMGAHTYYSLL